MESTLNPSLKFDIKRISASDTLPLRQKMLRPGKEIKECIFERDDNELTFHLGAFVNGKLASVASFYFEKHPLISGEYHFRLRGMCTLPEYQGKGMSSALLKTAIPMVKQNQCLALWCNARVSAQGFYEKVGFKPIGEVFEIPEIGTHQLMTFSLT